MTALTFPAGIQESALWMATVTRLGMDACQIMYLSAQPTSIPAPDPEQTPGVVLDHAPPLMTALTCGAAKTTRVSCRCQTLSRRAAETSTRGARRPIGLLR